MAKLFYMGRSNDTKSGVSWKIWIVRRTGASLKLSWGRAVVEKRKVVPQGRLQTKVIKLRSEAEARTDAARRIQEKISSGYERQPRPRPRARR
jgi:predicted DNA-binding WGR domain protein